MKFLVAGLGMLGVHVVTQLHAEGHPVEAFDVDPKPGAAKLARLGIFIPTHAKRQRLAKCPALSAQLWRCQRNRKNGLYEDHRFVWSSVFFLTNLVEILLNCSVRLAARDLILSCVTCVT
jgi:hypothetical protein